MVRQQTKNERLELDEPILKRVGALADAHGVEVYVVGGFVRDLLLKREVKRDIDFLVMGDGIAFAHTVARAMHVSNVVAYERFRTAAVPLEGGKLEFVGARREEYESDSRKPHVTAGTLEDDLLRRDFTVNAIAIALNADRYGQLLDPLDGRRDLKARLLRTPLDPARTFEDDPLRIMRAIRFAAQIQFTIEEETLAAIPLMRERLAVVSQERITDEFLKILMSRKPSIGLRLMYDTGVLQLVFPELAQTAGVDQRKEYHHKDVFLHTCQVVDNIAEATENLWLRFAALVHDIAKPRTKEFKEGTGWTFHGHEEVGARMMKRIFQRMKLPMDPLPYVEKMVRFHLRPMVLVDEEVTDSAVRRLVFEMGNDIDDLMKLCRADITSKNPRLVQKYLRNYEVVAQKVIEVEEKDRLRNWQPPVKGDEIMAVCGIPPGKAVGILKKAIEDAILDGKIANEHDAALSYLLGIKDEIIGH